MPSIEKGGKTGTSLKLVAIIHMSGTLVTKKTISREVESQQLRPFTGLSGLTWVPRPNGICYGNIRHDYLFNRT